jgi:hypothetical protein
MAGAGVPGGKAGVGTLASRELFRWPDATAEDLAAASGSDARPGSIPTP